MFREMLKVNSAKTDLTTLMNRCTFIKPWKWINNNLITSAKISLETWLLYFTKPKIDQHIKFCEK